MRHGKRGRKLGRTASHKKATMDNMATSLFMHGAIRTTRPKAKELRGVAERLITFAKRGDLHARRMVLRRIRNKVVVSKLFDEIGPSFSDRQGGYTRLLNLGPRRGDATEVCLIELVGSERRVDFVDTASSDVVTSASQVEAPVTEATTETDTEGAGEAEVLEAEEAEVVDEAEVVEASDDSEESDQEETVKAESNDQAESADGSETDGDEGDEKTA